MSETILSSAKQVPTNHNLSISFLEINNMTSNVLQLNARTNNIKTTKPWAKTINAYSGYTQTALSALKPANQALISLTPTLYNQVTQRLAACNTSITLDDATGARQAVTTQKNGDVQCVIDKEITPNGMNVVINVETAG